MRSDRLGALCWHVAMNTAMIITGVLLALGVVLTWSALGRGVAARAAQLLTLAGGLGYVLAGAYPADDHFLAALLVFELANVGMLVASLARRSPILRSMRGASLALGLTGLTGTALFLARIDLGFGVGGMARLAVFPLLIWTLAVAVRLNRWGSCTAERYPTDRPAVPPRGLPG
jgi:hypothetical membrane protein